MTQYSPQSSPQASYPAYPPPTADMPRTADMPQRSYYPGPQAQVAPRKRGLSTLDLTLIAVVVGLTTFFLLLLASFLGIYGYYQYTGHIVPGVYVGDIPLEGMTVTEAAILLQKTWNLENIILVTNGAQSQDILPADIGLSIDPLHTAQNAYEVGHDRGVMGNLAQMAVSYNEGWEIMPVIMLDEETARAGLEALTPQMSYPATDATLILEGTTLTPVPGELGYTINMEESLKVLQAAPHNVLANGILPITLKPVLPRIDDVSAAMAEAQRFMESQVTIQGYDAISNEYLSWTIEGDVIATWLEIETTEQGPRVSLNDEKVAAYLGELSAGMEGGRYLDAERYGWQLPDAVRQGTPLTVMVSHYPTSYIVQPGDTLLKISWRVGMPFWTIMQANPDIDPDALTIGSELVIPSKDEMLPLPVVPNKRIIISISKQRLTVFQDGAQIAKHVISTGIDRSPTQPGIFQVQSHELEAYASVWDLYMPHFIGVYEAWPGFMNGIHGLPTLSSGQRLWANILGSPASYGCIILDLDIAAWLYDWAEDGVVVEIVP